MRHNQIRKEFEEYNEHVMTQESVIYIEIHSRSRPKLLVESGGGGGGGEFCDTRSPVDLRNSFYKVETLSHQMRLSSNII